MDFTTPTFRKEPKVISTAAFVAYGGITPAYAGKSSGESKSLLICSGSPPPMRGKADRERKCRKSVGITPAYAGKSATDYHDAANVKDHPRLCGEKVSRQSLSWTTRGSPPPMRGKAEVLKSLGD